MISSIKILRKRKFKCKFGDYIIFFPRTRVSFQKNFILVPNASLVISALWVDWALTVQTFPIRALTTVVSLVEVIVGARVVINWVAHVHVPGVPVAELAIVPLGPVRCGVGPVIEGSANDIGNLRALSNRLRKQMLSDHS